jgi:hypothetical protein
MTVGCNFPPPATCRFETEPVTTSVAFEDAKAFEADLRDGSLTIEGWDKPDVEMVATVRARALFPKSAERLAKDTKVSLVRADQKVLVKYEPARSMIDNERVTVDVVVRVPRQVATQARTQGTIKAGNLAAATKLYSHCGNIVLRDVEAPVDCSAHCGNVQLTNIQGSVTAAAHCGNIQLSAVHGSIAAKAHCGNVTIADSQGAIDCKAHCGNVRITSSAGWTGEPVKARADLGRLKVSLGTLE